jgi:hypothetical protein
MLLYIRNAFFGIPDILHCLFLNIIFSVLPPRLNSLKNILCGEYLYVANIPANTKNIIIIAVVLRTILNIFVLPNNENKVNGIKHENIKYAGIIIISVFKSAGALYSMVYSNNRAKVVIMDINADRIVSLKNMLKFFSIVFFVIMI